MTERKRRMKSLVNDVWFLERNIVSDGLDRALDRLKAELPLIVHNYSSGTEVWTWIIPDKWTCYEAYLENMNGVRLIDYKNHPLHCASYSSSFEGVVTREELFRHLQVHSCLRDAIPYAWKHYQNDWSLSCTAEQKEMLKDEKYRVVIRTKHSPGVLKVGEFLVKGETDREFILCAHLCHPCMVNDDLSGVVVAMEVMRKLATFPTLRYTYRLLLTPETIGSIAWLSSHEDIIPKIKGGLFLEMLGTNCPHALQMSFNGNTEIDKFLLYALKECDPDSWHGPFRQVIGNDERQFNAPGVRIPMQSISRVFHPETGKWPYPEYHSSKDTPDFISYERLDESVNTILHMIKRLEENCYPVNLYRGELCCSRYGLFIDFYQDPKGNRSLFDMIQMIDGTRTVSQIADACNLSFDSVMGLLRKLEDLKLVRFSNFPVDTQERFSVARRSL